LAHELTHAALSHLTLPLWLEEGLCQTFEHLLAGRVPLLLDGQLAARHKRYWNRRGLDEFWHGTGFAQPGKVQELSYQLAEVLLRLLIEESRPRLFGLVRRPRQRLLEFLRTADEEDCGAAACRESLQRELGDLAALFLGPGEWSPRPLAELHRQDQET